MHCSSCQPHRVYRWWLLLQKSLLQLYDLYWSSLLQIVMPQHVVVVSASVPPHTPHLLESLRAAASALLCALSIARAEHFWSSRGTV